ncbi:MAG: hypothetical protein JWO27_1115 [Frankiales bacterium]|jgi:hypothetical protein|nr:hypothetical protein [Frankiales bacterium]
MEHVVFFPAHDGTPAFRRVSSLEDAVRLVEHLRNVESVAELSVHALTEVPLAFKAFYRVEVPAGEVLAAPVAEVPSQELPPPLPVADIVPVVEDAPLVESVALADADADSVPVPALAVSNGHSEAAPSSLGFFAS